MESDNFKEEEGNMARTLLALVIAGLLGVVPPAFSQEGKDPAPPPAAGSAQQVYQIGPGDVVEVSVWKDEALTRLCTVRPDGFISFPLVGDVAVAGKTLLELRSDMEERLKRFVPGVVLSLDVKQVNSQIIYVIGKVNSPGRFVLNVDVNVLQALAAAGGLNVFANSRKIKIFRHGSSETTLFPFDYDEVVDGRRLEQNIYLKRGDVVVVP